MVAGQLASSVVAASLAPPTTTTPPPTTVTTTVLDEVMEAFTLTITTTTDATASDSIVPCCHGSTSNHFLDGRAYRDVIQEFLAVYEEKEGMVKFVTDHKEVFTDLNFGQYIFAVCTSWYLKIDTTNGDMNHLLAMATMCKYHSDPDKDKMNRYVHTLIYEDDRSVINCLSRETKSFCDCMQAKKVGGGGSGTTGITSRAASSSPTALWDELMDALSLATTAAVAAVPAAATATIASENSPCCHGSTSDHFLDGRTYRNVIEYYVSVSKEERDEFSKRHPKYFADLNFSRYIFALCTSWYLKTKQMPPEMRLLLGKAIFIKYLIEPLRSKRRPGPDYDKLNRYVRAIMCNDRGIVNCLWRETKAHCVCMNDKKREVKRMEKTEFCVGCKIYFPRDGMMKCNSCNHAMFCTEGCYAKYGPAHSKECKDLEKITVALLHKYEE